MDYISRNLYLRISTVARRFSVRGVPGKALFIQRPGATEEDYSVVVAVLLVSTLERTRSKLIVLDAKDLKFPVHSWTRSYYAEN